MPAAAVAVELAVSISTTGGRPSRHTRSSVVATMGLNEWPLPSALIRLLSLTIPRSSSTDSGRCTRAAPKVTLPAQFEVGTRGASAATAVGAGDDLEEVAVVAQEVDAAAAVVVVVDLARLVLHRVGPV